MVEAGMVVNGGFLFFLEEEGGSSWESYFLVIVNCVNWD